MSLGADEELRALEIFDAEIKPMMIM